MRTIPERDWKLLRSMKPRVLSDACARILNAVELLVRKRNGGNHETYLALWKLIKKEDASIAFMFDDFKRSTAFFKLAAWQRNGLVSESDLALFTEKTRNIIKTINENAR